MDNKELDKLEALAKAATPGRWMRLFGERTVYDRMSDGCRGNAIVRADLAFGQQDAANLDFIAAANPAAILELIALARSSLSANAGEPIRESYIKDMEDTLSKIGALVGVKDDADALIVAIRNLAAPAATAEPKVPEGFLLVPKVPTDEMRDAGNVIMLDRGKLFQVWRAMIAAAPTTQHVSAAPAGAGEVEAWISVEDRLPEGECLAVYVTPNGKQRLIRAKYARQFQIEAEGDDCETEYNEDDDTFYIKAGWLECIDNWGEYSSCYVTEGTVTHWKPSPALPAIAAQPKDTTDTRRDA